MSKTVGMITIYQKNYGAFLQAYALQQALLKSGYEPEIIRYNYYRDRTIMGIPLVKTKKPIEFIKAIVVEMFRYRQHKLKTDVFAESIKKHIYESNEYYESYKELAAKPPQYDLYLTGSDQVFNPRLSPQAFNARLLCFVQEGIKASYAASAGLVSVPPQYEAMFASALRTFAHISVREMGLCDYLRDKFDIPSIVHIDPTFLLTKDEWGQFAECEPQAGTEYIFYYRVLPQESLKRKAGELSQKLGLPIYVADGNDRFEHQLERKGTLSPEAWVGMLLNSAYVVTNSFHGAAFAVNLQKRASIIVPPAGGERVKNLLKSCSLTETMKTDMVNMDIEEAYAKARVFITKERAKTLEYFADLEKVS